MSKQKRYSKKQRQKQRQQNTLTVHPAALNIVTPLYCVPDPPQEEPTPQPPTPEPEWVLVNVDERLQQTATT